MFGNFSKQTFVNFFDTVYFGQNSRMDKSMLKYIQRFTCTNAYVVDEITKRGYMSYFRVITVFRH